MPKLGDYLGQLIREATIARMHADLETVRVAELYASHPLLQHFSVPRFRLPEVELDVPVAMSVVDEPISGEEIELKAVEEAFQELWPNLLRARDIEVPEAIANRIREAVSRTVRAFVRPPEVAMDVNLLAGELTNVVVGKLDDTMRREDQPKLKSVADELRNAARIEFIKHRTPPRRLTVLATAAQLQDVGGPNGIIRIRMKLTEDGVEWASDDNESSRLVPE